MSVEEEKRPLLHSIDPGEGGSLSNLYPEQGDTQRKAPKGKTLGILY